MKKTIEHIEEIHGYTLSYKILLEYISERNIDIESLRISSTYGGQLELIWDCLETDEEYKTRLKKEQKEQAKRCKMLLDKKSKELKLLEKLKAKYEQT